MARDMTVEEEIGRRVLAARRKLGISQDELAERAGLHRTTIGLIEQGKRNVRTSTVLKLAAALEVVSDAIVGGIEFIPGPPKAPGTWTIGVPPDSEH